MSSAAASRSAGQNSMAEVLTGIAVLAVAAVLLFFIFAGRGAASGYEIIAKIPQAAGLGIGTDVRVSGIKVGSVSDLTLDPLNFLVTVHMDIQKGIQIPTDSSMQVNQVGALGGLYIAITPGGDAQNIPPGGRLENAQGSVDLMGLAARFLSSGPAPQTSAPTPAPAGPSP